MTESGIAPRIRELERLLSEEKDKVRKLEQELSGLRPHGNDPARGVGAAVRVLQDAWLVSAWLPSNGGDFKTAVRMLIGDALAALDDHTPLPRADHAALVERCRALSSRNIGAGPEAKEAALPSESPAAGDQK